MNILRSAFVPALCAMALATGIAGAQTCLTTLYADNNSGSVGGAVYFDANLSASILINSLDCNFTAAASTAVTIDFYTVPTTYVGNEANIAAWTLLGRATGTAVGRGQASTVTFPAPILVNNGAWGIALVAGGSGHAYTNGNGSNQNYSDPLVALTFGAALNVPFTGTPFTPRVWNGAICYNPASGLFPNFDGAPRSGASPLTVQFTDKTYSSAPGGVQTWAWDFDNDGVIDSRVKNPLATYPLGGKFTVKLTVTDGVHSPGSVTKADFIEVDIIVPNFGATPTSGPVPLAVQFTDTSTGGPTSWAWDFGDGNSSTAQNPLHTYTRGGKYAVKLTATNSVSSQSITKPDLITALGATNNTKSADILEYQFNEVRGTTVANTASTTAAPSHGTMSNAGWHAAAKSPAYRGNEAGFGAVAEVATTNQNWVSSGWPLDARNMTIMWWHKIGAAGIASTNPFAYAWGGASGNMRCFFAGAAGVNNVTYRGVLTTNFNNISDLRTGKTDVWQHLALVVDDVNGVMHWYLDGLLDNTLNFTPGTHLATATGFHVGRWGTSTSTYSRWYSMDDFRFYGRALSAAEVAAAMASESPSAGTFGTGCAGPGGVPRISSSGGAPSIGNGTFAVDLANAEPGRPTAVNFGLFAHGFGNLPINVSPFLGAGCLVENSLDVTAPVVHGGSTSIPAGIPNNAAMKGAHLYAQFVILGSGAGLPTNGAVTPSLDINIQ
jgi:PKD repeat protein